MSSRVTRVRVERRNDAALADVPSPRLSWVVESDEPWQQAAAEVRLDGGETVRLDTSESVFVDWPFAPLAPHSRHELQARVTSTDGVTTDWSEPVAVRSTFLADGEWRASFIGLSEPEGEACPGRVRAEFQVRGQVRAATLYATAGGGYQVSINGADVDDAVLKPGWRDYHERLVHEATDVTGLVREGSNAIGIRFAGAWWTEKFGFHGAAKRIYGDQPVVAAQLQIEFTDGSTQVIGTDGTWRGAAVGELTASSIYQGEAIDGRRALAGWDQVGFDDATWPDAVVQDLGVVPEADPAEPVRRVGEVAVAEVIRTPSGKTILDFGQNLVGWLRVRVRGPEGHVITVRHAEVLEHGELGVRPLRHAQATDTFVCSGGDDVFEPEFTFHGFRYAEIENWPEEFDPEVDAAAFTAVVISSDMRRTGWFECSDERVNRLHENVVWGMKGNFVSIPTDCPQRDERLGWTGDIQVFSPTATSLFDSDGFLTSWLRDVALEQARSGGICPFVVPSVLGESQAAAAWGDAATVVPMVLFERFGDRAALAEQYPSMKAWVDVLAGLAGERLLWEGDFQFGDWLDPAAPPDQPGGARTDSDIVASAHVVRSAALVAKAADLLGFPEDAAHYRDYAERARKAWVREYVTGAGRIVSDSQTAYAMAISYGLLDAATTQAMGDRLAEIVRRDGYVIGTGFVGTPIIADALCATGHADAAGRLLLQTGVPSWLYAVTMGATTIWERWDSMLPDGTINPGEMTSFNHYAFGAVADWLHRGVAGLAPEAPGYARLRIAPTPIEGLEHASVRRETPYGFAESGWAEVREGRLRVHALVPANTTAEVALPGQDPFEVGPGRHEWEVEDPRSSTSVGSIGWDTPLGAIVDDRRAHEALLAEAAAIDPGFGDRLRRDTDWRDGQHLAGTLHGVTGEVRNQIPAMFERVNAALAG
ncbi:family 78 glycoside hydrolase catalytic domain [Ruania alkalisoli]|uniref:alpha-L-rhamnosidase n=1 Tax=Ruania alkalisoli TaxID=2779775 RepID=A0A7M1ST86_9MICO|nr:alpha-L-rhamnosidase [Ruania alkalisoli]QOR70770.1 family 78 glycoside hydrolase catalytic domain [Ruania alkalisoli]